MASESEAFFVWCMSQPVYRSTRRKARRGWSTTPPRCGTCRKQPPVCECGGES